jgi:GTPase SAR1 family protein
MEFKHPFSMIIAGPSGSGKTVFVDKLLKGNMFDTQYSEVLWCYGAYQPQNQYENQNVRFIEGLPELSEFDGNPKLVILDDLMHESDARVSKIFTKYSHHNNVSVIFITQNLFHQKKDSRDVSLNSHYIAVFKNPRDRSQISHLARQMYPRNSKILEDAFFDATSEPHGYLLIDMKQSTLEDRRILTNIFDKFPTVYVPVKNYK